MALKAAVSGRRGKPQPGDRILGPVAGELRNAAWLSILAGVIWPLQAAAIAWAIAGWAGGQPPMDRAGIAALAFAMGGIARALLEDRAGAILFRAAEGVISRERGQLIRRAARAPDGIGSAEVAALIVQKLPLLAPWISRYQLALMRTAVLPLLLLLLSFWHSWLVGLTLLIAGPLIPVFMALVGMAAEQESRRQLAEVGTLNGMLMERLSAMLDIRLLGAGERMTQDFRQRADTLRVRSMAVLKIAFLSSTVLELFSALGVAMVAVFVGFTLLGEIGFGSWGTPLSLGEGVFLLLIAPEFFQPMRDLAAAWHDRATGLAVIAELDELDRAERVALLGRGEPGQPLPGPISIRVEDAVALLGKRKLALPDIILGPAETLALTGPSGIGKTTALAAIAGLLPLAAGRIEVNGRVLDAETADDWRARVAFVPQKAHFSDMCLGEWLDLRRSGADQWPALRLVEADRIVTRLPRGLGTRLGETGGGVSGGEARRLMLARAVLSGGDLILADEPTADLDAETADRITQALLRLAAEGRSIIVATHDHRLAAAMGRTLEFRG
ncbi:ATP-binding cassette domain-containing protein [Paracoccus sp. MBLB3053]|uniref:ATP-binding cassette domain-containing protein n=1 Tax=Paracoccus aurantius TaxID=3073814 RepID=A0ABU2HZN0_9RHOB|nr:ATP-binding cassette domain-containing protein [Paracoccus sp. MBLB3053]MDS9470064.1 ATP-binding cassette domain-containing protein [Paracoccus sp. MBLB3053]